MIREKEHMLTCSPAFPDVEFLLRVRSRNSRKQEESFPYICKLIKKEKNVNTLLTSQQNLNSTFSYLCEECFELCKDQWIHEFLQNHFCHDESNTSFKQKFEKRKMSFRSALVRY